MWLDIEKGAGMESGEILAIATAVYNEHFSGCCAWRDDLIGEGVLGILVCEQKYNPSKGKFIVYAWRSAWGRMMAFVNTECRHRVGRVELEDLDTVANEPFKSGIEWDDIRGELAEVRFRKQLHNAVVAGILDGERQCDLARKLGLSTQCVGEIWKRWKRRVVEQLDFVEGNIVPR